MFKNVIFKKYRMYLILLLLIAVFGVTANNFFSVNTILTILRQVSLIAIASIGGGIVVISGGVDISVGSIMSITTVIGAYLMVNMGVNIVLSAAIALAVAILCGIFMGVMITKTKIPPMICGLGVMTAVKGLGYLITGGVPIFGVPASYKNLGQGSIWGIPNPVIIMIVALIIAYFFLTKTYWGRYFYSIGSNEEAARLSGLNVNLIRACAYIISGFTAGLSGLLMLARIGQGNAVSYSGFEMDTLTAVIIGGISFSGGSGNIVSVFVGALIMGVLKSGLVMIGASEYWQQLISGLVLVSVVAYDSYQDYKHKNAVK